MLIKRWKRRLLTTSSTAATVHVAPRWMAKPITPAQRAEIANAMLVSAMVMVIANP